jgi:hypothetical protein
MIPEAIQATEELVQLFKQAKVDYCSDHCENEDGDGLGRNLFCLFTFGDCKVSVECYKGSVAVGRVIILYQTGQKMLPKKLASVGFGEAIHDTEVDEASFEQLKGALKLRESTSSQLLAALIWCEIPSLEDKERTHLSFSEFCHTFELLTAS